MSAHLRYSARRSLHSECDLFSVHKAIMSSRLGVVFWEIVVTHQYGVHVAKAPSFQALLFDLDIHLAEDMLSNAWSRRRIGILCIVPSPDLDEIYATAFQSQLSGRAASVILSLYR